MMHLAAEERQKKPPYVEAESHAFYSVYQRYKKPRYFDTESHAVYFCWPVVKEGALLWDRQSCISLLIWGIISRLILRVVIISEKVGSQAEP